MAKANNLELEIVHTEPAKGVSNEYLKVHKLGRVPSFVGADGYELTECIAIAIYSTPLIPYVQAALKSGSLSMFTMMKNLFKYSYPCLKTTVEKYSHSDKPVSQKLDDSLKG